MRCGKARSLMLLYREGELSPERHAALIRHYASCAECADEAGRIVAEFIPVDTLRRAQPVLNGPSLLTLRIMRGIEGTHQPVRSGKLPLRAGERFLPVIRFAGVLGASVLVLLYVTLSYKDARTLASLEERLGQLDQKPGSTAAQLAREASSQLESRNHRTLAEAGIRPDEAGRALRFLISPHPEPTPMTIENFLRRKYPALASVTLQDGLDERERTVLANEGERFLKDLERLIRKEKSAHEQ